MFLVVQIALIGVGFLVLALVACVVVLSEASRGHLKNIEDLKVRVQELTDRVGDAEFKVKDCEASVNSNAWVPKEDFKKFWSGLGAMQEAMKEYRDRLVDVDKCLVACQSAIRETNERIDALSTTSAKSIAGLTDCINDADDNMDNVCQILIDLGGFLTDAGQQILGSFSEPTEDEANEETEGETEEDSIVATVGVTTEGVVRNASMISTK